MNRKHIFYLVLLFLVFCLLTNASIGTAGAKYVASQPQDGRPASLPATPEPPVNAPQSAPIPKTVTASPGDLFTDKEQAAPVTGSAVVKEPSPEAPGWEEAHAVLPSGANLPDGSTAVPRPLAPGWNTLMSENFEGAFPSGSWVTYDADGETNGEYFWDKDNFKAAHGIQSAWPAKGGKNGLAPGGTPYPDNLDSWMVYGPFSLVGYTGAELQFNYWNQTEQAYDYFRWMASTDGINFYGYQVDGESGGWVPENFNLTTVPTLGNLSGDASVYIAFEFISDLSIGFEGPFVDDILLRAYEPESAPDLAPFTPGGWSGPIVASSVSGTQVNNTLYSHLPTYIDWAVTNTGATTTNTFLSCLYYDDAQLNCWYSTGLSQNNFAFVQDWALNLAPVPTTHVLKLVVDMYNNVAETNESNNVFEQTFEWLPPSQTDLAPYTPEGWDFPIVPSPVSGTFTTDTLNTSQTYIDMAIANHGPSTTVTFSSCLYFDNTSIYCWDFDGMPQNYYKYLYDWLLNLTPTPGTHTLKIVADVNNTVAEASEANNSWEFAFYWYDACPASSHSPGVEGVMTGTIMNDAFPLPKEVADRIQKLSVQEAQAGDPPASHAPGRYDTSDYLQDSVAIGIVLPESSGSMEDWTGAEQNCVVSKIQAGMNWWKTRGGATANLDFFYDIHPGVPTSYEPIDHSDGEVDLWIDESLTNMGYGGSNIWEQTYDYLDYLRDTYHTKWATVFFVADSSNDPDGRFRDSQYFAWSYIGGPYVVMTYDNDGWGVGDMNWVAAHEFGHVFWAGDQYYQAGYGGCTSTTQRYGYLGIANANCQYNNNASVPSIMRMNENALDTWGAGQIGWRDTNSNGTNNVVETAPAFSMTPYTPDPTTNTALTYTGYVYDQPWPHAACGVSDACNNHDITINTIASATYRVDGGSWTGATPVDGTFNSDVEGITFTTSTLSPGAHTIEVRAVNSRGAATNWSDTVTVQSCYTLTTGASPAYAGSVSVLTAPNCGANYNPGTVVQLSAAANPSFTFASWGGDASGTIASTTVTMNGNRSATANFNNRVPTLASLNPASATAGSGAFTLTLNGANFVPNSVARWESSNLATTYISATQITAAVPPALLASAGTVSVTVFNPVPGGGVSGGQTFTINNPAPSISSLNPSSATAGSGSFSLTVYGSSFVSASKVRWNGGDLTTTYVSATQLSASVTAGQIASAGTVSISVFNPSPGGGASSALTFTINNPAPSISSLFPTYVTAGNPTFTLTVYGTSFVSTSTVQWNGNALTTTYASANQLNATVSASLVASAGAADISVFTPAPGGGASSVLTFPINNPIPAVSSISPASATAGSGGTILTVNGDNFVSGSAVRWNGENLTTTYVSATQLTASISASRLASAGTASVTVYNPTPGGGTSGTKTFTINNPLPTLSSTNPASALAGGAGFTLTLNGMNFVSGSVARWNSESLPTTYVTSTQLTALVSQAQIASGGAISVTVVNPGPGGGASGAQTFTVNNPAPTLSSLNPPNLAAGSAGFTLTLGGASFMPTSQVRWNSADLITTYISATQLSAAVPASLVAAPGTASVTVYNLIPGGGTSNALTFTINSSNPLPVLSGVTPGVIRAGRQDVQIRLRGSGFVSGAHIHWNGDELPATFVSSEELTADLPDAYCADPLEVTLSVDNPAPGGGVSNEITLQIVEGGLYLPVIMR